MEGSHARSRSFCQSPEWLHVVDVLALSRREAEVIACLLDFCDDDGEIGRRLGISKHTVHSYFEGIYRKLGVNSRCQVLARVLLACFALHEERDATR